MTFKIELHKQVPSDYPRCMDIIMVPAKQKDGIFS